MIKIEQISEIETDILIDKINKEKSDFPSTLFFLLIMFNSFIFLPGRHSRPSLYREYGFWKPSIIITLITSGLAYSNYKKAIKNLQSDLDSKEKVVEEKTIWKKNKSFIKNECLVWVDSDIKDFQKFPISIEEYEQIEKGQKVILEYGKMSNTLYKIDFNIKVSPNNSDV